ncbi:hypothetical protein F5Y13DRAFT_162681 [Hypoxylon sp. FL1857]|nr:hypothetical protein F5Y13DRAFT_162681 [Hypoxylon sp. FL1857]
MFLPPISNFIFTAVYSLTSTEALSMLQSALCSQRWPATGKQSNGCASLVVQQGDRNTPEVAVARILVGLGTRLAYAKVLPSITTAAITLLYGHNSVVLAKYLSGRKHSSRSARIKTMTPKYTLS